MCSNCCRSKLKKLKPSLYASNSAIIRTRLLLGSNSTTSSGHDRCGNVPVEEGSQDQKISSCDLVQVYRWSLDKQPLEAWAYNPYRVNGRPSKRSRTAILLQGRSSPKIILNQEIQSEDHYITMSFYGSAE